MMGFQIKKLLGIGLVGSMALEFGNMMFNIPKQLLQTALKIQMNIVCFPFRLINTFYRLIFKPINMTCNCTKTPQGTSKVEISDIKSPCSKYVLPNIDSDETLPCYKPVQANSNLELYSPCHKSAQANSNLELYSPCHKSAQANADLEQNSPRWSVQTNQYSQQSSFKTVESLNKDNINKDDDDNFEIPPFPNAKSADYLKYSTIMKKRTLKLIDELSNFVKSSKSADDEPQKSKYSLFFSKENLVHENNLNDVDSLLNNLSRVESETMKSLKCLQQKKEKMNKTHTPSAKSTLSQSDPTIEKAIRELDFDCLEKNADAKNIFHNSKHAKNISFQIVSSQTSGAEETHQNAKQVLNLSLEVLRTLVDTVTQEITSLKSRLTSTNIKIEEILKSSNSLFEELSGINERFNRLINLSNKITDLQRELGEGHKLFQEIEAERNDMQLKLKALEKIIKEEEEYLDVSYESGYDEAETHATPPL